MRCSRSATRSRYVGFGFETDAAAAHFEVARPWQQLHPMQDLAQVSIGALGFQIGPEHRRQLGPSDPGALERKQGEQLSAPLEGQGNRLTAVLDCRRAEQEQAIFHLCAAEISSMREPDTARGLCSRSRRERAAHGCAHGGPERSLSGQMKTL
jgi:hypothetical protein